MGGAGVKRCILTRSASTKSISGRPAHCHLTWPSPHSLNKHTHLGRLVWSPNGPVRTRKLLDIDSCARKLHESELTPLRLVRSTPSRPWVVPHVNKRRLSRSINYRNAMSSPVEDTDWLMTFMSNEENTGQWSLERTFSTRPSRQKANNVRDAQCQREQSIHFTPRNYKLLRRAVTSILSQMTNSRQFWWFILMSINSIISPDTYW